MSRWTHGRHLMKKIDGVLVLMVGDVVVDPISEYRPQSFMFGVLEGVPNI